MKSMSGNYKLATGIVVAVSVLLLTTCGSMFYHNPQKARKTAYDFLNAVYMQTDFEKAYLSADTDFKRNYGSGYLEKISSRFSKVFGRLEGLRADAYLVEGGERAMMILFSGISEKAPSYHKVMLIGDGKRGYLVSNVIYSDTPFTGYRTLKFFK